MMTGPKNLIILLTLLLFNAKGALSSEICSRVAIINYQETLVDTNTNQKGEGLRFHLEKDEMAKRYLDKYQEGSEIKWENAILGTVGSGLIISGLMSHSNRESRKTFLISGFSLILINYLMAKTFEYANEDNLLKAIEEYNKRNLPKIYFKPVSRVDKNGWSFKPTLFLAKSWEF